jgi:hypothetical protein
MVGFLIRREKSHFQENSVQLFAEQTKSATRDCLFVLLTEVLLRSRPTLSLKSNRLRVNCQHYKKFDA